MSDAGATVACVLTPPGRGAVAVVRVTGPGALRAVEACFLPASGKPLCGQPLGAIRLGRWQQPDGEELIVVRRRHPPGAVEVHCHGGHAAVRGVVSGLVATGCVELVWDGLIEELADSICSACPTADPPTVLAALRSLGRATTLRTASVLWDQAQGALDRALRGVQDQLRRGDLERAADGLDGLLKHAPFGQRLTEPWRVVIAGPPNVGKSSLANALLGYERSVVFDQPGATRDVVTSRTAIDGWPVELSDTAGLRDATDPLERAGVGLAIDRLRGADVVIALSEGRGGAPPELETLLSTHAAGAARIDVASKCDTGPPLAADDPRLATSAATGEGVDALLRAIAAALPAPPAAGGAVPFGTAIVEAIAAAHAHCERGDAAYAQRVLAPWID